MALVIDHEVCTMCARCVEECPYGALDASGERLVVRDTCTLCGACVDACPAGAIELVADRPGRGRESAGRDAVWVYGEHDDGVLLPVVYELIGKGAQLAKQLGARLEVVLIGGHVRPLCAALAGMPVDAVRLVAHPALDPYRVGAHAGALADLIKRARPGILLAGATLRGRSLMPRVAVLCRTGLTADCTGLEIERETRHLLQTRPAFGGNVMATIVTRKHRPQMATVRPRVLPRLEPDCSLPPPLVFPVDQPAVADDPVTVLAAHRRPRGQRSVADARVLVAGGHGVGGPEGFELLRELAGALGGDVAASRAAVDAGWVAPDRQVGQTGSTVQPDLYVAVGISGAVQHRVGMQSAGTVVAINLDPGAPIFSVSDYGIVGDYREVVPALMRELQQENDS
jgi:electron transfer flavoprotein alpha subunit/NAD-dependent dihydropyrimidine dehydrogenase PreA subunit